MALYDRMMRFQEPKIPVHQFFSAMQEYALGNITGAQIISIFNLDAGEQTEALALYNRIMTESAQNGSIARRVKALEFENVLILAENLIEPYTTVAAVKTRLGV